MSEEEQAKEKERPRGHWEYYDDYNAEWRHCYKPATEPIEIHLATSDTYPHRFILDHIHKFVCECGEVKEA